MQLVWPDSFVEEANVARIVHMLRKTLGEDQNGNKFIETVAKKGYRFVAPVSIEEPDVTLSSANGTVTPRPEALAPELPVNEIEIGDYDEMPHSSHRFRWAFALLSILIVVAVAGWIGFPRFRRQGSASSAEKEAITSNTEAFYHFKEGKLLLERRKWEEQDAALEHFDTAIRLDPNFAEAFAGARLSNYGNTSALGRILIWFRHGVTSTGHSN